ncbi:hypothetical protein MKX07_003158 [Trichoderma sp. CBMAI-0711]|uniref:Uncharacterized protein n=1 Tax=Trichoderma parareesei TaxID=858221 RepID=A0A2H2Z6R4_TRIPA|nr:hypothetical protein MKX07_003158 [Trichoderma sp. CBMAI-0711]OTA03283.1 hypothetical protein A9Z42_0037070 [Trichoderma parareesei]
MDSSQIQDQQHQQQQQHAPHRQMSFPPHVAQLDSPACRSAIQHTSSWKPSSLDRRQSWSSQDQKHALQMSGIDLDSVRSGHQGFTERT